MIGHVYFDWVGSRDSVKEYGKKLEAACKKKGTKFLGIWSPHQDKWNFVAMIEAETLDDVYKTFSEAGGMGDKMTHSIIKYYEKNYP